MNGAQDLGGMQSFGKIIMEPNEPLFHSEWERRAFALTLAMGATGSWNIDQSRHARESLNPAFYLTSSYYQIWTAGLETLMLERGQISMDELETGEDTLKTTKPVRILQPQNVDAVLAAGAPANRRTDTKPLFKLGDKIHTINEHPPGHTRLPRYARDKSGIIDRIHGCHVFPDTSSLGKNENPHWLYSVRFEARDLWGNSAAINSAVYIDCWEPYFEIN